MYNKDKAEFKNTFIKYIEEKGLRHTKQREVIVDAFFSAGRHITSEELFNIVKKEKSRNRLCNSAEKSESVMQKQFSGRNKDRQTENKIRAKIRRQPPRPSYMRKMRTAHRS